VGDGRIDNGGKDGMRVTRVGLHDNGECRKHGGFVTRR